MRRLATLERRRKALASKIARKQNEITSLENGCRELAALLAPGLDPLLARARVIDADIHSMFEDILTTRKLGKRSYKDILGVYHSLQDMGLISPRPFGRGGRSGGDIPVDAPLGDPVEEESDPRDEWHVPASGPPHGSAARHGSVRDIFLQLASQFHPDRVTDADQQRRHTEIMMELNRAYRDGDVARLLEMERELDGRGTVERQGDASPEDRCAKLEEQITLLEEQLIALGVHLASLSDSSMGELFGEYRRLRKRRGQDPIAILLHELEAQLASVEEVADFVRLFRDGKMTIKRFVAGPVVDEPFYTDDELLEILEEGDVDALIERLMRAQSRL